MNAIKLPVHIYRQAGKVDSGLLWSIRDSENVRVVTDIFEPQAKQIALALNLHDELVAELERLRDVVGPADEDSIKAILSRAETANQTKP